MTSDPEPKDYCGAETDEQKRNRLIVAMAQEHGLLDEGTLEVDDDAVVSEDDGTNGAYVQAWLWVDFEGTPLDKHLEDEFAEEGEEEEGEPD